MAHRPSRLVEPPRCRRICCDTRDFIRFMKQDARGIRVARGARPPLVTIHLAIRQPSRSVCPHEVGMQPSRGSFRRAEPLGAGELGEYVPEQPSRQRVHVSGDVRRRHYPGIVGEHRVAGRDTFGIGVTQIHRAPLAGDVRLRPAQGTGLAGIDQRKSRGLRKPGPPTPSIVCPRTNKCQPRGVTHTRRQQRQEQVWADEIRDHGGVKAFGCGTGLTPGVNRGIEHHRPDRRKITHAHGFRDLRGGLPNTRQGGEITHDVMRCFRTEPRSQLIPTFFIAAQQDQLIGPGLGEEAGQC